MGDDRCYGDMFDGEGDDFSLATNINAKTPQGLGDLCSDGLTEEQLNLLPILVSAGLAQAGAAASLAHAEVMYFEGTVPEMHAELKKAEDADFIRRVEQNNLEGYRLNEKAEELLEKAYPNCEEWQYFH